MQEKISIGKTITRTPGEEKTEVFYTIPSARIFKLQKLEIAFPSGQAFKLQCIIFHGERQVIPEKGYLAGDGHSIEILRDWLYPGDSEVRIYAKNLDTAADQSCHVVIEGALE